MQRPIQKFNRGDRVEEINSLAQWSNLISKSDNSSIRTGHFGLVNRSWFNIDENDWCYTVLWDDKKRNVTVRESSILSPLS